MREFTLHNHFGGIKIERLAKEEPEYGLRPGQFFALQSGYYDNDKSEPEPRGIPMFFKCVEYIPGKKEGFFSSRKPQQYIIADARGNRFELFKVYRRYRTQVEDILQVNHSLFPAWKERDWNATESRIYLITYNDNLELKNAMEKAKADQEEAQRSHERILKEEEERARKQRLAEEEYRKKVNSVSNKDINDLFGSF